MRKYESKRQPDQQFELDGVVFTVPGSLLVLDLVELAELADVEVTDPRAIKAVSRMFRGILGDDYDRFHDHCVKHHTDNGTLIEIIKDLVTDSMESAGFPTMPASDSSGGTSTTAPTYTVVSPSAGAVVRFPLTPERESELKAAVESAQQEWERLKTG